MHQDLSGPEFITHWSKNKCSESRIDRILASNGIISIKGMHYTNFFTLSNHNIVSATFSLKTEVLNSITFNKIFSSLFNNQNYFNSMKGFLDKIKGLDTNAEMWEKYIVQDVDDSRPQISAVDKGKKMQK